MTSPEPSAQLRATVVAFDFDKTLSTRDCVMPFIRRFRSTDRSLFALRDLPEFGSAILRRDRDRLKGVVTRAVFEGRFDRDISATAATFAQHVLDNWMRQDTLEKLREHQEQGHLTGIVSASYGHYLRPIGEHLGLDFVISSELEIDDNGMATGHLLEGNCRGSEKARRLRVWIAGRGLEQVTVHAYGDSGGDRHLLRMADHAHRVRRREIT